MDKDDNFHLNKILEVFPLDLTGGAMHSQLIRDRLNDIDYDIEPKPLEEYLRQIENDGHFRVYLKGMYINDKYYPRVAFYTLTLPGKKFILNGGYKDEPVHPESTQPPVGNSMIITGNNNNVINQSPHLDNALTNPIQQNTVHTQAPNSKKTSTLETLSWVAGIIGGIIMIMGLLKQLGIL